MVSSAPQYLAFDLGASSGRALLGTLRGSRLHVDEVHRFETPLVEERERLFWDLAVLEDEIDAGLRKALEETSDLQSLSVDSWAVDYVPLDAEGTPLRDPYCYRDPRGKDVMEETLDRLSRETIYSTTGIQFLPINTLYQVLADQRMEPDLVQHTALRLPIADYIHYRYSDQPVVERSMASTTQLLDVRRHVWATSLMEEVGIDPDTWPEIIPPATPLGPLSHAARSPSGTPVEVVAGCTHDTACAVAAVPADEHGPPWAYISCGTWSLLGVEREEPVLTDAACEASFTNELGLDGTVRFLKNLTGLWILQECERAWENQGQQFDHDTLQREAAEAASLGTVDPNEPRFLERGQMPQKIRSYCEENDQPTPETRGEVVRLILESLAADYRDKLDQMEQLVGEQIEVVHLVGGGSRNELLCQWTADATGRRVVAGPAEATALGNLLIQARTMGGLPDGVSIRDIVRASTDLRTYEPG
ncbi:MAG: rhamnulokinase family protein [Salinibacter sp.]